jgi:GxxExxY protein
MTSHNPLNEHDPRTHRIIGCAMEVHRQLGPGLLEATYEEAMCIELTDQGISFVRQPGIPVFYKGHLIGEHRPDLVVQDEVVVEVKSVERLIGVHQAQLLAYMRLLKKPVGLLLNFNGEVLRTGIRRLVI